MSRDSTIRAYLGAGEEGSRSDCESTYSLLESGALLLDDGQDEAELKSIVLALMRKALHNVDLLIERLKSAGYLFAVPEYLRIPASDDAAAQVDAFEAKCGRFVPMTYRAWYETIGCVCLMGTHPGWPEITYNGLGGEVGAVCSDPLVAIWTPEFGLSQGGSCKRIEFAPDPGHKANYSSSGSYNMPTTAAPSIDAIVTDDDNTKYRRTFLDHLRDSFNAGGFPGWQHYDNPPIASLDALKCDFKSL